MRGSEKASVEKPPNPSVGKNAQWPDLRDSLASWSASFEGVGDGVPQTAPRPSATGGPKPGTLGGLGQHDNPQTGMPFGQFVDPGGLWRDLAAQINLRPEI